MKLTSAYAGINILGRKLIRKGNVPMESSCLMPMGATLE
jgi:hypothetical protein